MTAVHGGQRLAGDPALRGLRLRARLPEPGEPRVRADDPEQPAERPDPQVRLDMQERQGHVVRVPGLGEQRDEPRERGRRLPREAPERLTPVIGTLPGQQVQHLVGRGRLVAEHVHQRVREDVSPQHPPELRRVGDLLAGDELGDLRHRLVIHPRVAQPREFLRRRKRQRVVDLAEEPLGRQPLLGDHRVLAELGAEDLLGDLPDALLVPALPQRGGRRDRADASRAACRAVSGSWRRPGGAAASPRRCPARRRRCGTRPPPRRRCPRPATARGPRRAAAAGPASCSS